jgi:tripartite-type tricarboxylate transporter receptor subunit TctC
VEEQMQSLEHMLSNYLKSSGKQIIIDNRAGAAGIIAMEALAKSPPDGYTILQTNISMLSINPFIYNKLPFDVVKDFAPISLTSADPLILVVNANLKINNLKDLMNYANTKSAGLSYGSLGNGSIQHLCGHVFGNESGINVLHIAYKGAAPVTVDLLGGQIDMAFSGPGTVAGLYKIRQANSNCRHRFGSKPSISRRCPPLKS